MKDFLSFMVLEWKTQVVLILQNIELKTENDPKYCEYYDHFAQPHF